MFEKLTGSKRTLAISAAAIAVLALVAFGSFTFGRGNQPGVPTPTPTPATTSTPTPDISETPTPSPSKILTKAPTKVPTKVPTATSVPPTNTPVPTNTPTPVVFSVTSVAAAVAPSTYAGSCSPGKKFEFSAVLTANAAGTVTYKWTRSDGAGSPNETVSFSGAGTQTVTDSWTLGGPGFTYSGWEKVVVSSPNSIESNQASFTLACS